MNTIVTPVSKRPTIVPLKHRPDCPSARELFAKILEAQNFSPIVRTLLREGIAVDESKANDLIQGFLQWFSVGSVTKTKSFVMFTCPIDQVLHAMILNSKWYFHFCYNFTGVYTHHEPIQENGMTDDEAKEASLFTLRLLESVWGENLHPEFNALKLKADRGQLSALSVSCVGNDGPFDIVPITEEV